jgi:putative FmdB family regulatory protein
MPIYEYECMACGHSLDALQKLSDAPLQDCPACGKPALRKRVSAPRFRLKGGGWYETDFKKENRRNIAEGGEAKGASGSAGDKLAKTESSAEKPAPAKADSGGESKASGKQGSGKSSASTGDT